LIGCKKDNVSIIHLGTLGDSITQGVDGANYPEELSKLIPDNYQVTNYGVAGTCLVKDCFNPIWDHGQFSQLLEDKPAIITIMLGTNDSNPTNSDSVRANFENDYREMIDLFQELSSHPRILLCYPPPIHALDPMADSLIRKELIPIIDRLADDFRLEVIDTYFLVDDYPANYSDNLHPDKGGVETLAQIIANALNL
jgi:lysophospholipase L1-like esterase